jgi:hypothetical protein
MISFPYIAGRCGVCCQCSDALDLAFWFMGITAYVRDIRNNKQGKHE